MDGTQQPPALTSPPHRSALLVAVGTTLVILSLGGLALIWLSDGQAVTSASTEAAQQVVTAQTPTSTPRPTVTPLPPPTLIEPKIGTPFVTVATDGDVTPDSLPTVTAEYIEWTDAEKNALSWLCYGEVGGMGEVRVDACWSVLSTVRARYAYPNSFPETDVMSTLLRPGQFNVPIDTTRPAPDPEMYRAVEQYQAGARGSCNGYLFFDSVPGGPALCVIRARNGQFLEFHNG